MLPTGNVENFAIPHDSSRPIWEDKLYSLVSLYDMLRFYAERFCRVSYIFGQISTMLKGIQQIPTDESWTTVSHALQELEQQCQYLHLDVSLAQIARIRSILQLGPPSIIDLVRNFDELHNRVVDELKSQMILLVPHEKKVYLQEPWLTFGQQIVEKFPSLSRDIEEAGKSFAEDRNPACVFHLMRIMEAGLRALGKSLAIPSLDPQLNPSWERILAKCNDELNKPIKDRCAEWKVDNDFFSNASANLLAVKNAWRNPTMHVGNDYSDEVALDIYNAVRGFMRHLSTKLNEEAPST
jgi:hypothetical protein